MATASGNGAVGFLEALEPSVKDGNPIACAYTLRMLAVRGDVEAEQSVVEDLQRRMMAVADVFNRFAESVTVAFGVSLEQLADQMAAFGLLAETDEDQADYDDAPSGCWATSVRDDEEACDAPAVDELGLCRYHRSAMVQPS